MGAANVLAGWTTFPLWPIAADGSCACGDPSCNNVGKHPAARWGSKSLGAGIQLPIPPGYGIGLATGARSGVVSFDLDRKNGLDGLAALQALADQYQGELPITLMTRTPTSGYHAHYQHPGFPVKNSVSVLGPGIDVRGDEGYVVLPPSMHKCGERYEWLNWGQRIAECPPWLNALLLKPPKVARRVTNDTLKKVAARWSKSKNVAAQDLGIALAKVANWESFAVEGERDQVLFKLCRDLAREVPDADPGVLAELFAPSLAVMHGGPSVESVVEKFSRAVAELGGAGRPEIWISDDIPKLADAGEIALARTGDVYRRGDVLARVTADARIAVLSKAAVREKLSKGARWLSGENAATVPPDFIVDAVRDRGEWPSLRTLNGIAEVPVLRTDGTVLDAPGYDSASGILYHPRRVYPRVPEAPTSADVERAGRLLCDVVSDFPWEKPEHLTGWLAACLTPLARDAYAGPAPLFLFDATSAGSGKSLAARLAATIGTGSIGATAPWSSDEEERRKAITTYAREGMRVVCWDNVTGRLGGRSLCIALTEPTWTDRVLGATQHWTGPMRTTFYATANNVELGEDMDRRVVHVRLNPGVERPELRSGFRYPDVLAFVTEHQPVLTAAALTVLRGYRASGARVAVAPWGSFEAWAAWVVAPLVWCGFRDPGGAREELRESDPDAEHMRALVAGWPVAFPDGATVRQAVEQLFPARAWDLNPSPVVDAIRSLLRLEDGERPPVQKLGLLLRRMRGRVYGGRCLTGNADRTGVVVWKVKG